MHRIKIYYSVEDNYPPYRVDVGELFGNYLVKMGVDTEWYMRRNQKKHALLENFNKQNVYLPYFTERKTLGAKLLNKLMFWLCDVWYFLGCLRKDLDIIQVRDKYIAAIFGLLIARLKGVAFVYWCSYPFPEHYLELAKKSSGFRRLYCLFNGHMGYFILYKIVIPLSNHSFVQTEQMKRSIASYGVKLDKMTPVPMGVLDRMLTRLTNEISIIPLQLVYIGTLASIRHMHVLIEAFVLVTEQVPDATLIIVGDGDVPSERIKLQELTTALGIADAVKFTGFLPMDEAWNIAAVSQCCISPFYPTPVLNVASPTKLVEYMALGRPVICNHHPEQTELIQQSGAGLCVEWGTKAFADAIIWMFNHPHEAELMGAKGPAWVKANRTYSVIANQVMHKYQDILGKA